MPNSWQGPGKELSRLTGSRGGRPICSCQLRDCPKDGRRTQSSISPGYSSQTRDCREISRKRVPKPL